MKFLAILEKNKIVWSLIFLFVLFFLLRLPSIIEPLWYGDEGIYQVIGKSLHSGHLLYKDIWDNKPPLLYVLYAAVDGDQFSIRVASLIVGLFTTGLFFTLSMKLFQSLRVSLIITLIFTFLFATPILEGNIANAENFMLLPIIFAAYMILKITDRKYSPKITIAYQLLTGIALGITFLFKIVVVFDLTAFILFVSLNKLKEINRAFILHSLKQLLPYLFGFLIPFCLSLIYFSNIGALKEFIQAAFFGNVEYVGYENSLFNIPQGWLILKLILLISAVAIIFIKRKSFSKSVLFIIIWVLFGLFNTFFSGRPYIHYLLVLLPSFCLFIGVILTSKIRPVTIGLWIYVLMFTALVYIHFKLDIPKSGLYYLNTVQFVSGQKDVRSYQSFFDPKVPRDYAVATFIKINTKTTDTIFIWGNSAQIYTLSDKLPPNKYTVAYHVKNDQTALRQTQQVIDRVQPKYIIVLTETQPLPFRVPLYIMRFNMEGATVYERSI